MTLLKFAMVVLVAKGTIVATGHVDNLGSQSRVDIAVDGGDMIAIAEGIETETECDQMVAAGYRYGQGFLFGKPKPLAELRETLLSSLPSSNRAR